MFDFTTTTFIHDASMIEANPGSTSNFLKIGNHQFKYEDVVAIYRNPFIKASNAKLVVDVASFMAAAPLGSKRFKLDFYLRRSGDNNSYYSNDFVFKGKDFHYEWTDKQNDAAKVAKMINKIIRLYGDVYLKVYVGTDSQDTTTYNKLVFENDNYGLFTEALLKVYVPEEGDCCSYRESHWDILDELTKEAPVHYCGEYSCDDTMIPYITSADIEGQGWLVAYQGVNGFGTYDQILKDLRLPTMENFRWTSVTAPEMPIPGNMYTQYIFHQISCRGVLGGSAVGEVTHSKTTHVFFVPACGCGDDLDTVMFNAIKDAGMEKLILSTTASEVGTMESSIEAQGDDAPGTTGKAILSDKTTDPIEVENFEHDPSIKADTTNSDDHPHTSNSTEPEPSNP